MINGEPMRPEMIDFPHTVPVKACVLSVEQYPYHWHDALEIVKVLQGSVNVVLGNESHLLRENDIAIVNMDELHSIRKSEEGNKILHIYISPGFVKRVLPDSRYLFLYCCSPYHEKQTPERYRELKEYIARLISMLNAAPKMPDGEAVESLLKDMLGHILYHFDLLRWGFGTAPLDDRRVERFRQMAQSVSNAQNMKIGLKDMLATIDVTLSHLSYNIKETFGQTFQELLYYGKCEAAAKMLLSTQERIVDIALGCGFSDVKYLIKHFKQFFHHTPSEFRRLYRADEITLAAQTKYTQLPLSEAGILPPETP